MAEELSIAQKKEWAQYLFLHEDGMTQKDIAAKVGVSENSMSKWVIEGKWDTQKRSLLTTRDTILRELYEALEGMKNEAKIAATDNDPSTKPDVDGIYKLVLAIRKLENESGIGSSITVLKAFITFIQKSDFELAQQVTSFADAFIKSNL